NPIGTRPRTAPGTTCSPRGMAAGSSATPSTDPPACCNAPRAPRRHPGPAPTSSSAPNDYAPQRGVPTRASYDYSGTDRAPAVGSPCPARLVPSPVPLRDETTTVTIFAWLALFGWIPLVLVLFTVLSAQRAAAAAVVGAWLLLPPYRIPIAHLPDYSKVT